jgi:hypothetical protein
VRATSFSYFTNIGDGVDFELGMDGCHC